MDGLVGRPAKAWQSWRVFGRNIPWMPGPQEVGEDGSDSPQVCAFFFLENLRDQLQGILMI